MVKVEEFVFENNTYKISIGQNALDNWLLIDISNQEDIWFHTSDCPSSHVVLSNSNTNINNNNIKIPRQVITRCACICKANSKAKSLQKVEIIYTAISNIKKTNVIGQVTCENVKKLNI